jgi:hypothetical protein
MKPGRLAHSLTANLTHDGKSAKESMHEISGDIFPSKFLFTWQY